MLALIRVIMHIDMDAFYSSVEQRENPILKDKAVIVGADPKEGKGHGVVMGCSYKARKSGVHSALPISQAFNLCPEGIYLRPNFTLYEQTSEQVMDILRQFAEKVEQMSIDEAFLDVTGRVNDFVEAAELAKRVKEGVKQRAQLTCSVGVAPSKSLAKIASDFKKPNGLTVVPPERVQEFLFPLPVTKISGVGKKSSEVLKQVNINTIGELANTHPSKLTELFGRYGTRLWQIANGIDDEEVVTSYSIKSVSSETTFEEDVVEKRKVMDAFTSLINDVHSRALSQNILFRTVGIKVRFEDFATFTRAKTHTRYTNEKQVIEDYVERLYSEFDTSGRKIRLVGVRVSNLKKADEDQRTILSWVKS